MPDSTNESLPPVLRAWHELVAAPDAERLRSLLADEVTFRSPAVHTPQEGPELTFAYLRAALAVLGPTISYERTWHAERSAVLEFNAVVGELHVHGVDVITWDESDRITDFTVLVRPLRGLQNLIEAMGAELQRQQA